MSRIPVSGASALQSRNNPLLKRIRAIIRSGELADGTDLILETPRLIAEARASNIHVHTLIFREPLSSATSDLLQSYSPAVRIVRVSATVFDSLPSTERSPGVVALCDLPRTNPDDLFRQVKTARVLIVTGAQDPGNLGTMLRTAEAFGLTGAILTQGTVSPWNAKAFRASAGSALRLPMLRNFSPAQVVQLLDQHEVKLYVTVVRGGCPPEKIAQNGPIAIAIGGETAGVPEALERASQPVSIPMAATVDSLNAAAAAAIILYEISRDRRVLKE
jgi:TrmH family RNA methyltransferase